MAFDASIREDVALQLAVAAFSNPEHSTTSQRINAFRSALSADGFTVRRTDDDSDNVVLIFAMLGAMTAAKSFAANDIRLGSRFQGASPSADLAGLTAARAETSQAVRAARAMFIHGYVEHVEKFHIYTNDEGIVTECRPKP